MAIRTNSVSPLGMGCRGCVRARTNVSQINAESPIQSQAMTCGQITKASSLVIRNGKK